MNTAQYKHNPFFEGKRLIEEEYLSSLRLKEQQADERNKRILDRINQGRARVLS